VRARERARRSRRHRVWCVRGDDSGSVYVCVCRLEMVINGYLVVMIVVVPFGFWDAVAGTYGYQNLKNNDMIEYPRRQPASS